MKSDKYSPVIMARFTQGISQIFTIGHPFIFKKEPEIIISSMEEK
jgi:hypothetical protein